ncbi:hypothetical protein HZC27_04210 [Candidatus Roizmanbacteria bacterium]|nr:hypothetical protein [Candidatus Roizmanbacteria bacterium]
MIQPAIQRERGLILTHRSDERARLRTVLLSKQELTNQWVQKYFPGYKAEFFNNPIQLKGLDDGVLHILGKKIAEDIVNAFGDWYPYRNREPEFNFEQLKKGKYLPYFGFILPGELSLDEVLRNPVLFKEHEEQIILAATASFLEDEKGFAELARDARRQTIYDIPNEFNGGIPSLNRIADWLDNKDGLADRYHTLFSQIRACEAHGRTPTSASVQNLQIKDGSLKIAYHASMFNVGGVIETDFGVRRTRDAQAQVELNRNRKFYTYAGNHVENIAALWQHQLGEPPTGMEVAEVVSLTPQYVTVVDHGENIYGSIEIHGEDYARNNGHDLISFDQALATLDDVSPCILVKVPAESNDSVTTQKYLQELGFTVCGVEPALATTYVVDGLLKEYCAPITLYFAKLGRKVREKQIMVVPSLILDGLNGTAAIYEEQMGNALRNIDARIRAQINYA